MPHRVSALVNLDGLPSKRAMSDVSDRERTRLLRRELEQWLDFRRQLVGRERRPGTIDGLAERRGRMNPRLERDHNDPNVADSRNNLHNVMNDEPVLLVREYLYETAESKYLDAATGLDQGRSALFRKHRQQAATAAAQESLVNVVPAMPAEITVTGNSCLVAGVYPNWGSEGAAAARPQPRSTNVPVTNQQFTGATAQARWMAFLPAPRANDNLRGDNYRLDPQVKFIREVWVQSNTPLGAPFCSLGDQLVLDVARGYPAYYGGAGGPTAARVSTFKRASTADMASGQFTVPVPMWTMTVTIRVYRRNASVAVVRDATSASVDNTTRGQWSGLGYDPAKPLATLVGYFGLRRTLRY
jgi:hypothetical protein